MRAVELRIDHLAVEIAQEVRVGELEDTLRTALTLLASRLATAPLGGNAPRLAIGLLEVELLTPDQLAGPGAAARLADELYRQIAGSAR